MIRIQFATHHGSVEVSLPVRGADDVAELAYIGALLAVAEVQEFLEHAIGLDGHRLGSRTFAASLALVLREPETARFEPEVILGHKLLDSPPPPLPGGVIP